CIVAMKGAVPQSASRVVVLITAGDAAGRTDYRDVRRLNDSGAGVERSPYRHSGNRGPKARAAGQQPSLVRQAPGLFFACLSIPRRASPFLPARRTPAIGGSEGGSTGLPCERLDVYAKNPWHKTCSTGTPALPRGGGWGVRSGCAPTRAE